MNEERIVAQPAALMDIGAGLGAVATALPLTGPAQVSIGDGPADAAVHEFAVRWTAHLRALGEITRLTARQAELTALAFRLAGG